MVALSVVLAWLRQQFDSVWPCAILHASHNLFLQRFFTPLTRSDAVLGPYLVDEFGMAVPTVVLLLATAVWMHRRHVAPLAAT